MTLTLIANNDNTSHLEVINKLLQNAEEVVFTSPFLFDDFNVWLEQLNLSQLRRFVLVTTLAPKGDDQLRKPHALLTLYEGLSKRWTNLEIVIQVNNRLHGKAYLFKKNGIFSDGIVTSANLTHSGLNLNHEFGIHIRDPALIVSLKSEIESGVEYPYIGPDLIRKFVLFSEQYARDHSTDIERPDINASLLNALAKAPRIGQMRKTIDWDNIHNVFLKPWGTKEKPVRKQDHESFGDETGVLPFPKGKPSDVGIGDLIITFGIGARSILSLHQVLSSPEERPKELQEKDPDARRWPWFVFGQNYTPKFGSSWWEYDINIDHLTDEYLLKNPSKAISEAGGDSLGTFQFGAGRLRLTKEFGKYIADRIMVIEAELCAMADNISGA